MTAASSSFSEGTSPSNPPLSAGPDCLEKSSGVPAPSIPHTPRRLRSSVCNGAPPWTAPPCEPLLDRGEENKENEDPEEKCGKDGDRNPSPKSCECLIQEDLKEVGMRDQGNDEDVKSSRSLEPFTESGRRAARDKRVCPSASRQLKRERVRCREEEAKKSGPFTHRRKRRRSPRSAERSRRSAALGQTRMETRVYRHLATKASEDRKSRPRA